MSGEKVTAQSAVLYNRVVLKISGESLGEFSPSGERSLLDSQRFAAAAEMIAAIHAMGVTTTVVVGGGNIFRGSLADKWELKPEQADEVGMDSTRVNVRLLRFLLFNRGLAPAVFSRGPAEGLGSRYDCEDVRTALHRGEIVLLAGGLGVPGISTDVTAIEAAIDTGAPAVIMTKHGVDGVYTSDPHDPLGGAKATRIPDLTASYALEQKLQVMDAIALRRARSNGKLIHVIPAAAPDAPCRVLKGEGIGSRITPM